MKSKIPWNIITKVLDSSADSKHIELFNRWIKSDSEHQQLYEKIKELWKESGSVPVNFSPDAKAALNKVKMQLGAKKKSLINNYLVKYAVASSITMLIGIGLLIYSANKYIKVSTDTNRTELVLSDGSHIWLNEHSSVKYAKEFKNIRRVSLKGEAYFEIAKNPQEPFIVDAGNAKVRVLGTHFNVRSVPGEQIISVVVSEGKVSLTSSKLKDSVFLTAGDKGILSLANLSLSKIQNDDLNFLSWKTGEYVFDNKFLEEIINVLAKNFHAKFEFQNENLRKLRLNVTFKNKSLNEIVEILASTTDENFVIKDNNIIIISEKQ